MSETTTLNAALDRFAVRMLQECMAAALPATWFRRAATLEAARPRPGEFHGRATAADLAERDRRLAAQAEACRRHAEFLRTYPDALADVIAADVAAVMGLHGHDDRGADALISGEGVAA